MIKGFVFGKFLPFHLGHKGLIDFGIRRCDELTVLVCASSNENISGSLRAQWISETFNNDSRINVVNFEYDESTLPNTSESSKEISKVWAEKFIALVPDVNVLFTSEPYGEYVSAFMGIKHEQYDQQRCNFPITGSQLRLSIYRHWDFLPAVVRSHFQKKIVLSGTESVGKSTLANQLSTEFRSTLVQETGRDIIPDSNRFSIDQLKHVADSHANNIMEAAKKLEPLIFIDTDIYITQSYAKHAFGNYLNIPKSIYDINQADLYLYLTNDVTYVQDGTRLNEDARNALDQSHRKTLDYFGIKVIEISGNYVERKHKAVQLVKELINGMAV